MRSHCITAAAVALTAAGGAALACYHNQFEFFDLLGATLHGTATLNDHDVLLTPDVSNVAGGIVFPTLPEDGGEIDSFSLEFDHIVDTGGAVQWLPTVIALGDLPDATSADPSAVQGIAVELSLSNSGDGNFVNVYVWRNGAEFVLPGDTRVQLSDSGWESDVPVSVKLGRGGALSVAVNGQTVVSGLGVGYHWQEGHRLGISAANTAEGAELRIDNVGIDINQASVTNDRTAVGYESLQDAVDEAIDGDVIEIGAGTLCEWGIVIEKSITIRGQGMDATTIDANQADLCLTLRNNHDFTVEDLTITNGKSIGNGGVSVYNGAAATFTGVRFLNNSSVASGGAIARTNFASRSPLLLIERCEFINNTGEQNSGAIASYDTSGGWNTKIINCLFVGNTGMYDQACIRIDGSNHTTTIDNCTFVGHPASPMGDPVLIRTEGEGGNTIIFNCVFADNGANILETLDSSEMSLAYCLLEDDTELVNTTTGSGILVGSATFEDAANGDYRLARDSLGIDAGHYDGYASHGGSAFDMNGEPRPVDDCGSVDVGVGAVRYLDLGPYEFQGISSGTVSIENLTTGVSYCSLPDAIDAANNGEIIQLGDGAFPASGMSIENKSIEIRGYGMDETTIDAGGDWCVLVRGSGSTFTMSGLTIANAVTDDRGGAVQVWDDVLTIFSGVRFLNNTATIGSAGALYRSGSVSNPDLLMVVQGCEFIGNRGGEEGGAMYFGSSAGRNVIVNTLFSDNTGGTGAAAINIEGSGFTTSILNCTFVGHPLSGDGDPTLIRTDHDLNVTDIVNCVFAGNDANVLLASRQGEMSIAYSLLQADMALDNVPASGGMVYGAPTFEDADAGDYRLAAGSLGIDAADFGAYLDTWNMSEDLAGNTRHHDDPGVTDTGVGPFTYLDMGAYEFQGASPPTPCNAADLAEPFGALNFFDVSAFLNAYNAMDPAADLAEPFGVFNFFDVSAFITSIGRGCP